MTGDNQFLEETNARKKKKTREKREKKQKRKKEVEMMSKGG